jgi:hypothetical protein
MWKITVHPVLLLIWILAVFTFSVHLLETTRSSSSLLGATSSVVENRGGRSNSTLSRISQTQVKNDGPREKGQGLAQTPRSEDIRKRNEIPECERSASDAGKSASDDYWRNLAVTMARRPASAILEELENKDPFGVREFERRLQKVASDKKEEGSGSVTLEDIRRLFPCPTSSACRLAKVIDPAALPVPASFRARQERIRRSGLTEPISPTNHTWILFQHLRKAGGTHFCSLAQQHAHPTHLTRATLCSPDGRFGPRFFGGSTSPAGSLGRFTNDQLVEGMSLEGGYALAANEWDKFEARFLELPAVLVTSFRDPVDRAVSQYLFECVTSGGAKQPTGPCVHKKGRDGDPAVSDGGIHPDGNDRRPPAKNVVQWWQGRNDLYNNYVQTFAPNSSLFRPAELQKIYSSAPLRVRGRGLVDSASVRAELVGGAYDVLQQFHLVTVMEWLEHAGPMFRDVLGWNLVEENEDEGAKNALAGVVRPGHTGSHPNETVRQFEQAIRADAARIRSDPSLHGPIREYLALDTILNDAMRRLFVERLVCY